MVDRTDRRVEISPPFKVAYGLSRAIHDTTKVASLAQILLELAGCRRAASLIKLVTYPVCDINYFVHTTRSLHLYHASESLYRRAKMVSCVTGCIQIIADLFQQQFDEHTQGFFLGFNRLCKVLRYGLRGASTIRYGKLFLEHREKRLHCVEERVRDKSERHMVSSALGFAKELSSLLVSGIKLADPSEGVMTGANLAKALLGCTKMGWRRLYS